MPKENCVNSFSIFSLLSRSLIAACTDNDVNTVRKLLGEGNSLNEATDDGESLLSLACSAGYYELAQVKIIQSTQKYHFYLIISHIALVLGFIGNVSSSGGPRTEK